MGKFFNSKMVQQDMDDIHNIQKSLWKDIPTLFSMTREEKEKHIEKLETLLEKQKIMYTRLILEKGDPDADEMLNRIKESALMMGFPDGDMNTLFNSMTKSIENLRRGLDN